MLEKLLLAVDDSAQSRKAVPATAELARAGGGTVNVLHVRELHYPLPPTVAGDRPEDAQRLVDDVVGELEGAGVTAEGASGPAPAARRPAAAGLAGPGQSGDGS
jgi:nucleotide-binding universal stress UspA family protein